MAIAATGMIYLSYFLCNLGVLVARRRGWPHKARLVQPRAAGARSSTSWRSSGAALMIINIGLWTGPGLFGVFGNDLRELTNPFINTFLALVAS